jgi:superfamily II DNA or RNA helicase/HKD family nuclease
MTRIIDNEELLLSEVLSEYLADAKTIDIAVGYFNLRGYATLASSISEKSHEGNPVARILVGMSVNEQEAYRESRKIRSERSLALANGIDDSIMARRRSLAIEGFRSQLASGVPTNADLATLQTLKEHLSSGRIKIQLYTEQPLHGKCYILHTGQAIQPRLGFVGSSNLTLAGLTRNKELNVDVTDLDGSEKLSAWFDNLWANQWCVDISMEVIALIEESWASSLGLTPYEVYLKVCYHLSQDARDGSALYELPPEFDDVLLDYQKQAVQIIARRIDTKGGALLGDVVGLGKTLTAVATAAMLQSSDSRYSTLIVCPPNLQAMWKEIMDDYKIHHTIVPYSMAKTLLPNLARFEFVIADESHYLRNHKTESYTAVTDYLKKNQSKVLLLSATPLNTKFKDVANQLALYIGDDDDIGFEPEAAISASPGSFAGLHGKLRTFAAFRKSKEAEDWARLLGDHLVRRTRTYIRKNFAKSEGGRDYLTFADGTKFFFPERHSIVKNHSYGANDPANLMASPETIAAIESLKLPRNALVAYLNKSMITDSPEDQRFVEKLARARGNLVGIARSSFLKRLSSGGHPFILSLRRHLARNLAWVHALENGLPVPVGASSTRDLDSFDLAGEFDDDAPFDEDQSDVSSAANAYDILLRGASPSVTWIRPEIFSASLKIALQSDIALIQSLLDTFGSWSFDRDSKLQALLQLINEEHPDEKILIFTEYRDTAEYLHAALNDARIANHAVVTSDTKDPNSVAKSFSPRSNTPVNKKFVAPASQLRILVTTDVLSEGQNLQDGHIVVNFDLPWAIIKLVQRAGRVDRVGQQSDQVLIYSFFHDEVEPVLNLRNAIRARLSNIAQTIGNDEKFLGDASETNAIEALANGKLPEEEDVDDVDAVSKAFEVWSRLEQENPALAKRIASLPNLVYSTRNWRIDDNAECVTYAQTASQVNLFGVADYVAEEQDQIRPISENEALKILTCRPDEEVVDRLEAHFDNVDLITQAIAEASKSGYGQLDWVRRNVIEKLKQTTNPKMLAILDEIRQRPLTSQADSVLNRALRAKRPTDALEMLILSLFDGDQLSMGARDSDNSLELVVSLGIKK